MQAARVPSSSANRSPNQLALLRTPGPFRGSPPRQLPNLRAWQPSQGAVDVDAAAIEAPVPPTRVPRVGGCLSKKWRSWQELGAEPWTVSTIRRGYRLPFLQEPPPLSSVPIAFPSYRSNPVKAEALNAEVRAMMEKGALEEAPCQTPGFYLSLIHI